MPLQTAIIGAGMAGIAAARILHAAGCRTVVFEKSRGFGGRCATKRWEDAAIDHGAQYFTIRHPDFRTALDALPPGALLRLEAPVLGRQGSPLPDEPRFYHRDGNSRLARDLATGLDVRTGLTVQSVLRDGSGWRIEGERFDRILSTAPWPQTAALAGLPVTASNYAPCLTLVLRYHAVWPGRTRGAYAHQDADAPVLAWTACENHKESRVPTGSTILVAQASTAYSLAHLEHDPATWAGPLQQAAAACWGLEDLQPAESFTHRWRYARRLHAPDTTLLPPGWLHAGDGMGDSRVESAWLSGETAARSLLSGE